MWTEDKSSHSQSAVKRQSKVFEAQVGGFRLVIVWGHIYYPNEWSWHMTPIQDTLPLGLTNCAEVAKAKAKAKTLAKEILSKALLDLGKLK